MSHYQSPAFDDDQIDQFVNPGTVPAAMSSPPPPDRGATTDIPLDAGKSKKNLARLVCCILGVGSLVGWNAMLTINDYYYHVFPKYHPSRVLTVIYQLFAIVSVITLTYNEAKFNTQIRSIFGYTFYSTCTFCLIILDLVSRGIGSIAAYIVLCLIVGLFGIANACTEGSVVGELSSMGPEFIQAFMGGLGIAGVLTSCLRLITKAIFGKSSDGLRKGALLFIGLAALIQLACTFLYTFVFAKIPIVKHYRANARIELNLPEQMDKPIVRRQTKRQLLRKNLDHGINLILIYVVTLSIFPGFLYEDTGKHGLGDWYALVLIAMFNVLDSISRFVPTIKLVGLKSRKWITVCVVARFLFIPAFYFTAKYADQGWMIFLTSLLGFTNGYLTVCIFSVAPKDYNGPDANALGSLLVACLFIGVFAGVCLGWLWLIGNGSF